MSRDFSRPQSPRRAADLIRHLSEAAERADERRRRLAAGVSALLAAPADGPDGLRSVVQALLASAPSVDAAGVLARDGTAALEVVAATGLTLEAGARFEPPARHGPLGDAIRARREAVVSSAAEPLPRGTRAGVVVPVLSRGEVLGVVVAASRSAGALSEDDLLLARLAAERAGRALERRALVDTLAGAEAVARGTHAFRDQILGIVGHDLRNPLGAIVMSAALLAKRGGLGGWQHKTVGRVRSSAARMQRLIDDLLSYTRTRLGTGIPISRRPADAGELARKVVDELVAFHPDCAIHVDVDGDVAGEWDPARVEQVVSNLVANALDHGEPDCGVRVELRGEPDAVRLRVTNRGEMPPVVRDHAFEPFRRPPEGEARRASGLGLGLYIAKEIVRGHGGTIALRSAAGETRVEVALPRRAPPADAAGA